MSCLQRKHMLTCHVPVISAEEAKHVLLRQTIVIRAVWRLYAWQKKKV